MRDALGQPQSLLVLGGTSEIGLEIALQLAKARTKTVLLAGRNAEALESAAKRLAQESGAEVQTMAWDAKGDQEALVAEAFERLGRVDMVLVAVGLLGDQRRDEADAASASEVMTVNYTGAAAACLVASRHLARQGQGILVVLSSVAAVRVRASNFVYGSSKAALDGFCQGLGDSLAGTGVEVMIVRPGFVRTKMTAGMKEAPFSTDAAAVAQATLAGLARKSPVVWSPPAIRFVALAMRLMPRAVFRRLPL